GLLAVVIDLRLRLEREAAVALDATRESPAIGARGDAQPDARDEPLAARVVQDVGQVCPDLAVEGGAAGVEHPDHGPPPPAEGERAAEPARGVAPEGAAADHHLAELRAEH